MTDPASRAAIERVANGDHSMDAIAQLLLVLVSCQQSTNDKVAALVARSTEVAAAEVAKKGDEQKRLAALAILRCVLWIVLGLIVILAGVLDITLPFFGGR